MSTLYRGDTGLAPAQARATRLSVGLPERFLARDLPTESRGYLPTDQRPLLQYLQLFASTSDADLTLQNVSITKYHMTTSYIYREFSFQILIV